MVHNFVLTSLFSDLMSENKEYCCPVCAAVNEIGGKWKPLIIWALWGSTLRFSEITRILPIITQVC